jgi:hypothetical protein
MFQSKKPESTVNPCPARLVNADLRIVTAKTNANNYLPDAGHLNTSGLIHRPQTIGAPASKCITTIETIQQHQHKSSQFIGIRNLH